MKTILKNVKIYNISSGKFEQCDLCLNGEKIVENVDFSPDKIINAGGRIAIPSFVSCYGNANQWLENLNLSRQNKKNIYSLIIYQYLKNGFWSICEESNDIEFVKELIKFGFNIKVVSNDKKILESLTKIRSEKFVPCCKIDNLIDANVDELVDFSLKHKIPMYSSLFSSLEDVGRFSSMYDKSPQEFARNYGLMDGKLILLNNLYFDKDDAQQLKFDDIEFEINCLENMYYGNGMEPIAMMKNEDLNISFGVGKDIMGLDMFEQMRMCLSQTNANMLDTSLFTEEDVFSIAIKKREPTLTAGDDANFLLLDAPNFIANKDIEIKDIVKYFKTQNIYSNFIEGKCVYLKENN